MGISTYDPSRDPEFQDFIEELKKESDRGIAIICHAYIEDLLKELLKKRLIEDKHFIKRLEKSISFDQLLILCFITGVIKEKEKQDIKLLDEIRNKFAHRRKVNNFDQAKICDLCNNLIIPKDLSGESTRIKYVVVAGYYIQILNLKLKYTKKVRNIEAESPNLKLLDTLYTYS